MNTIRTALVVAALTAVLASCGSDIPGSATAPAVPPSPAEGPTSAPAAAGSLVDEAAVETVFRGYYQALLARDFATACALNAPETNQKLLASLQAQQGVTVTTCEQALETIYTVPGAAATVSGLASTTEIQGIMTSGDTASVTWSTELQGRRSTVTSQMRRVDGEWRLVSTSA